MTIRAWVDFIKLHQKPNMVIAEVGVFRGDTFCDCLSTIVQNNGFAYAIDWFCGSVGVTGSQGYCHNEEELRYNNFLHRIKPFKNFVKVLKGISYEVAKDIPNKSLDMCFIDASHKYLDIKMDIEIYMSKVKDGGILAGHDCDNINWANTYTEEELLMDCTPDKGHAGVIQAVYDFFGKDIEILPDPLGGTPNSWIKRL